MQINAMLKYHFIPTLMPIIKKEMGKYVMRM